MRGCKLDGVSASRLLGLVAIARNWSAKAEYLFVNLADGSCTTNCAIADASGTQIIQNVAVKFNEKRGPRRRQL